MKRITSAILSVAMMASMVTLIPGTVSLAAPSGIEISVSNFPDYRLRRTIKDCIDTDGNEYLSDEEINCVTSLTLEGLHNTQFEEITNLKGLEQFKNLTWLEIVNSDSEKLDFSCAPALTNLYINECANLKEIDVSKNANLEVFYCTYSPLASKIDFGSNPEMYEVSLEECNFSTIDFSKNNKLEYINLAYNPVESLKLGDCSNLEAFSVAFAQPQKLDLSKATDIYYLYVKNVSNGSDLSAWISNWENMLYLNVFDTPLNSVDLSKLKNLESLVLNNCGLSSIDLSHNKYLNDVSLAYNSISSINLDGLTEVEYLSLSSNKLKELDVSKFSKLDVLWIDDNELTSIDVSNCPNLHSISARANKLSSLDVSKCEYIHDIWLGMFDSNSIESLTLGDCKYLNNLEVEFEKPAKLDLSKVTDMNGFEALNVTNASDIKTYISKWDNLVYLTLGNIPINSIDVSHCEKLASLQLNNCGLTSLDVSNNKLLETLSVCENSLTSIDISNNTELTFANFVDEKLTDINVGTLNKLYLLQVDNNELTDIDVSNCKELSLFSCSNNNLTKLDVSKNSKLVYLQASCNNLTQIDVSANPILDYFDCNWNRLTSLDLSNNKLLTGLSCYGNNIDTIDINGLPLVKLITNPMHVEFYADKDYLIKNADYKPEDFDSNFIPHYGYYFEPDDDGNYSYLYVDLYTTVNYGSTKVYDKNAQRVYWAVTPTPAPVTPTPAPVTPIPTPVPTVVPEQGLPGFIERLYNVALGRQSEAAGKEWWINKVKFESYTGSDVAKGFLESDEFLSKPISNEDFLELLYKTYFDRASDAQGKAYWLNLMANGYSKQDVINGFCNSTEWANLCLTYGIPSGSSATPTIVITPNEGTNAFVTRLYTTCLGRTPEAAGFEYWTYRLSNMKESGSSAAYGFFTSPEFTGKGYDNPTYVTLLYRTILGREPEQAGLNYWLGLMANGMGREDVLKGFAASTEWANICSGYGILK